MLLRSHKIRNKRLLAEMETLVEHSDQSGPSIPRRCGTTHCTLITYLGAVLTLHLFNCFGGDEMLKTLIQSN